MKAEAKDFAKRMIPDNIVRRSFNNANMAAKLKAAKSLIAAYKNTKLDYVNFHWYMPARISENKLDTVVDKKAVIEVVSYLRRATNKPVISNETGQLNNSPNVVTQTVKAFTNANVKYLLWYSGDGGNGTGAIALHNNNGSIRANGLAYIKAIQQLP
jgi:hypothetical protein